MDSAEIYGKIKTVVEANLPGAKVLLFGSRANGAADEKSDYDLLIITPTALAAREKIGWTTKLDRALVEKVQVPVDIILQSFDEIEAKRQLPGHLIRTAMREGIML